MVSKPSEREKAKYLDKIREWRSLGFEVEGLEELLEGDFELFKKRRLEILRGQIGDTRNERKPVVDVEENLVDEPAEPEAEEVQEEEPEEEEAVVEDEDIILVGKEQPVDEPGGAADNTRDEVMLVGKPLPVEAPAPDDEDTILVGDLDEGESGTKKVKKVPKDKKVARVRELEGIEDSERVVEEEEEEEEEAVPVGMMGLEAASEQKEKKKGKEDRKRRPAPAPRSRAQFVRVTAVVVAGILIMSFIWYMIYIENPPGNGDDGNGDVEVEAVIDVDRTTGHAGETFFFDADDSTGDIKAYRWVFDTDFRKTSGFYDSAAVAGYFTPTDTQEHTYQVSLSVESQTGQVDTETVSVTVDPLTVSIPEEQLGDNAKYRVSGDVTITNPSGEIAAITYDTGNVIYGDVKLSVDSIVLNYRNATGEPMTSEISDADQVSNGFSNEHDVYSRHIVQNLDITGNMQTSIDSITGHYEESLPIIGTMHSDEESFTDYTTDKTMQIRTENDLDMSSTMTDPITIPLTIESTDELTSYPDLRQMPTRLRLSDLSGGTLDLDDKDTTIYGSVAYTWDIVSADQVLGSPALKLEVFVDSATLEANNIDVFRFHLWLGDGKPVAIKTEVHVEFTSEGNDIIINYENRLTEYISGSTEISSRSCNKDFDATHHYPVRYSDMKVTVAPEFTDSWTYMPGTKISNLTNSFEDFSPEEVMNNYVLVSSGVSNYLANNPDAYVVTGYLNATKGELIWNITFGKKGSTDGYYIRVGKVSGALEQGELEVNIPNNSTDEMWPVATYAGSEYIFKDISDAEITSNIFLNDRINFAEVSYGVSASLSYPTVDFTSVSNFQTQRLVYFAIREKADGWFTTALDAETGQILFKWNHEYVGIPLTLG